MKWNGRSVLMLVVFSMILSSVFTITVVKENLGHLNTSGAVATVGDLFSLGSDRGRYPEEFAKLYEIYEVIKNQYVEEVPADRLIEGAIDGMIMSLNDPYSEYMDPVSANDFNSALHSTFQGIGAEVTMKEGRVTIVAPFKGSPAESAGLRPNDQILSVNGESLEGLDLQQAVSKIRGPKGTKATLKVLRPGLAEPITVVVVRDDIPIETVRSETIKRGEHNFGKLEIVQFSSETAKRFAEELKSLEQQKIDGLIIDVRGNPGGYLTAVKEIGEMLVPHKGSIVKIEYGQRVKKVEEYRSTLDGKKPYPIVVLIDNGSASASEILAGALRDSGGYKLVGETTFGKGTVQNTVQMEDKSQLKLTIAKWLTPKGEWVHQKGIEPTVKVSQPDYFKATQLPQDKVLAFDMTGTEVKNLQVILSGLGYAPGRSDGYFDKGTEAALKQFQTDKKLPATGKVDNRTASALQDALIEVIRDPKNDLQLRKALEVLEKEVN